MAGSTNTLQIPDEHHKGNSGQSHRRNSLGIPLLAGSESPFHVVGSARRRLSNVSDVVSRKISHTIGWRSVSASIELIVSQGSTLCAQYIRNRLKRSGIFQRKLGLKRMRSAMRLAGGTVVSEVYPELTIVGAELEKMHPNLFIRIGRQIGVSNFTSEQTAAEAMTDISREMLRTGEMTWSKIIALYAVAGGIAVDCVRQGKPEYIAAIQRAMTEVLEEDLATWIQANGGWSALVARYRPVEKIPVWQEHRLVIFLLLITIFVVILSMTIRSLIF